jgi:hypothetical protein
MHDPFDVGEGPVSGPSAALDRLKKAAAEAIDIEAFIKSLEETLSDAKTKLHHARTKVLPDMMAEIGMSSFSLDDGTEFSIDNFVSGSLPKSVEGKAAAIKWLEENDAESLIKSDIKISFGRNQHNEFVNLREELTEKKYDLETGVGVHAGTLAAFVREKLEHGDEVPLELLGMYAGRIVKIKPPKVKKLKGNRK